MFPVNGIMAAGIAAEGPGSAIKRMKKASWTTDPLDHFRGLIHSNLDFISRQCRKAVTLGSRNFVQGPVDIENENDILFNRVLEKLSANDFHVLRKFEGRSRITTYLSTVISRTSVDMIREKRGRMSPDSGKPPPDPAGTPVRDGFIAGDPGEVDVPDLSGIPEEMMIHADSRTRIRKAVREMTGRLTPGERLLIRMKYSEDRDTAPMSTAEISELLGISPKAVYNRLERLMKKCRKMLNEAGITENAIV